MLAALTLFAATWAQVPASAQQPEPAGGPVVEVRVDPRVELVAAVFRLAGAPEYAERRYASYAGDVITHFGAHRGHAAVEMARTLRTEHGISYDAVMSFALHLGPAPDFAPPEPAACAALERRWTPKRARDFALRVADFAQEADFAVFAEAQAETWALAERRMRALVEEALDVAWYERWFGRTAPRSFTLVVAPGNGGMAYGPRTVAGDGSESFFAVLGAWLFDEQGRPAFDRSVLGTVVHEFAHSFVNPWVGGHLEVLRPAADQLYPLVDERMRAQAYADGRSMLCESLVRAAVVAYLRDHDGEEAAEAELTRNEALGFLWIRELDALLADGFGPRPGAAERSGGAEPAGGAEAVLAWASEAGPRWERKVAEMEAVRPKLVESTPENGATGVVPGLGALEFRFDRPMVLGSYSVLLGPGGQTEFPEVLEAGFDATGEVFTLKVRLEAGRRYRFSLNGPQAEGFRSQDGAVLAPLDFTFETTADGN